jgi:hypothetical protein
MDGYRVMQVGPDFIVFSGDVGVLKCRTEKDAQAAIAVAMEKTSGARLLARGDQ